MADSTQINRTAEKVIPVSDDLLNELASSAAEQAQPAPAEVSPPATLTDRAVIEPIVSEVVAPVAASTSPVPVIPNVDPVLSPMNQPPLDAPGPTEPAAVAPSISPTIEYQHLNYDDLPTDEQKFIRRPSVGALWLTFYFFANHAVKHGVVITLIFMGISVISTILQFALLTFGFLAVMNVEKSPVALIVIGLLGLTVLLFILGIIIYSVWKGRRIAWKSRLWPSFAAYKKYQKRCDLFGWLLIALIILYIVAGVGYVVLGLTGKLSPSSTSYDSSSSAYSQSSSLSDRMAEASDTRTKSLVGQASTAAEACYVQSKGSYLTCDSVAELQSAGYLTASASSTSSFTAVKFVTFQQSKEMLIYVPLEMSTATCERGQGETRYYAFDSRFGADAASVWCADADLATLVQ